jgi:hypothetical protein
MAPSSTAPDCQLAVYDLQIDSVNDDSLTSHPGRILRPLFVPREQKESKALTRHRATSSKADPPARLKNSRSGDAKKRLARLAKTAEANQLGLVLAVCSFGPPLLSSMTP